MAGVEKRKQEKGGHRERVGLGIFEDFQESLNRSPKILDKES